MSQPGTSLASGADLVEQALEFSRADACVVIVRESSEATLRFAGNTLTTNGFTLSSSVAVASVIGASVGTRSATIRDPDDLVALIQDSESAARQSPAAEDAGPLVGGGSAPDFAVEAEHTSFGVFDQLASDLGVAFGAARAEGRRLYGYAAHDLTTTWLGTSAGLRLRHVQPTGYLEVTAKNDRKGGSSWWGQPSRDMRDLSIPDIDAELQRRLGWTTTFLDLPAGRYDTVLPPSAVADMLVYAYWTAAGRDAAEGRSAFSRPGGQTRVGETVAPRGLRLWSDPLAPGMEVEPFVVQPASGATGSVFDNGLGLSGTDWIHDGVLANLTESRFTAGLRPGTPVTPFVDNLLMDAGGTGTTDELVAGVERGLLLTCLWYIRVVDPESLLMTGLTRDGVYLIEDGRIAGVVNNFRYNESPIDLLGRVTGSSASQLCLPREWSDFFRWAAMPALRIPDFNMSSVSPAT